MVHINETKQVIAASQYSKERDYWLEKLSGELEKTTFPYDWRRLEDKGRKMDCFSFSMTEGLFDRLVKVSNNSDVRLHIILVAGWMMLLHKYTGNQDIIVGMPTYKQKVEGQLINTVVALRGSINSPMSVKELLVQLGQTVLEADKHQNYPVETLVYKLDIKRDGQGGDFPLFDVSILLDNIHDAHYLDHIHQNMVVSFHKSASAIEGVIEYNTYVFRETTIQLLIDHFHELMKNALADVNTPIAGVGMISGAERNRLLVEFNDHKADFSHDKSIYRLFEEFAYKTPQAPALLCEGETFTYDQINRKANKLARVLVKYGITTDHTVGVLMERGPAMVISILATWKAGGAYIPLDTDYPAQRLLEILSDSQTRIVLAKVETSTSALQLKKEFHGAVIDPDYPTISKEMREGRDITEDNLDLDIPMNSLAYVIYTSGSTGKPKGAMVEHIGMMNHIQAKINTLCVTANSIVAQNASHTFDISVWQFFVALVCGGKTVIYSNSLVLDPETFIKRMIEDQLTIFEVVPSYLSVLLDILENNKKQTGQPPQWSLQYILVTGEEVKPHLVTRWFDVYPGIPMINAYGPTEASDDITHHVMTAAPGPGVERIPLGKPIQNLDIYIVDEQMSLCPIGIKGEICVSGVGVGRGYLNDDEKTRQAFTTDPFSHDQDIRLYKTGDLGCWLPDGTIEFFGRKDFQVKIRGFRIELGEIENRLLTFPGIKEAVVIDREDENNNKTLCAYFVLADKEKKDVDYLEIKKHLARSLPDYMIPAYGMTLDKIPLTPNGKIDRKALPEPFIHTSDMPFLSDKDLQLMKEQLENRDVKKTVSHRHYDPVTDMLAEEKKLEIYSQTAETHYYRLSHTQKMFYFLEKVHQQAFSSNNFFTIRYQGMIDRGLLEQAINQVIIKNPGLRLRMADLNISGALQPAQYVSPYRYCHLDSQDFCLTGEQAGQLDRPRFEYWTEQVANEPFQLLDSDLFYFTYIRFSENESGYGAKFHHLVFDGWMLIMLLAEIHTVYLQLKAGTPVDETPNPSYIDYLAEEKEYMISEKFKKDREFWHNLLLPLPPEVDLSMKKGGDYRTETNIMTLPIPDTLTAQMHTYNENEDSTVFKQMLAVLSIYISRVSQQEDFIIGSINHGRSTKTQKKTVGIFVDFFPIRVAVDHAMSFREMVDTNGGYVNYKIKNHIRYPYDILAAELREITGVDTRYFGNINLVDHANFQVEEYTIDHHPNKNDPNSLNIHVFHRKGESGKDLLEMEYEFHVCKYNEQDIERIHRAFLTILTSALDDPSKTVSQIDILSEMDRELVVYQFNHTASDFPSGNTIHGLFEEQVERTPGNKAVGSEEFTATLTYRELNDRSNQLAYRIKDRGVKLNQVVGIIAKRSFELITGILAILKAGAAYLPIGLTYPDNRIAFLCSDCSVDVILTDGTRDLPALADSLLNICDPGRYEGDTANIESSVGPEDPAAVLYTSGSTGIPKGVISIHRGIINRLWWMDQRYPMQETDIILQQTPVTFDVSMCELFSWMLKGASMFFLHPTKGTQAHHSLDAAILGQVTHMHIPPVFQLPIMQYIEKNNLTGKLSRLRQVNASGEALLPVHVNAFNRVLFRSQGTRLLNLYGPTEASIEVSCYDCSSGQDVDTVYIGKPISNIRLYIFDEQMRPVPVGIPGRLYIAGVGVARGYINRPGLTSEAFSPDPFVAGERMYFTGDVARWVPDGNVEFLGRIDNQVQLDGFRVEPGEIENILLKHKDIKEVAVVPWNDEKNHHQILCAFVQPMEQLPDLRKSDYKEVLIRELPQFMIPARFIELDRMPLTSSNKIDRKTLEKMVPYCQPGKRNISEDILMHMQDVAAGRSQQILLNEDQVGDEYIFSSTTTTEIKTNAEKLPEPIPLSDETRKLILETFNNTRANYPENKTLFHLFEEQVEKTPGHVAMTGAILAEELKILAKPANNGFSFSINYQQFNDLANILAHKLHLRGVSTDKIVGLMADRSIDMMVAVMAVLKAGGAYLMMTLTDPDQRIDYLVKDSSMLLIIKDNTRSLPLADSFILDLTAGQCYQGDRENLDTATGPGNAAAVFYTSGSTGKPKGVLLDHRGLVNRLNWMQRRYPLGENDVILQKTAVIFDVSMWELFWWSFYGASLFLMLPGKGARPAETVDAIHDGQVTTMHFTPTALHTFVQYLETEGTTAIEKLTTLRQVFASGEALPVSLVNRFNRVLYRTQQTRLINLYGPTEASIDVSYFDCPGDRVVEKVPIGKPIDNICLYIVGPGLNLLPPGVAGELCIAGVGLARGYLNHPQLTAEKFVKTNNQVFYKTGDLARWLPDGNIEFLGRIDHQVQINGIRIELEEVENLLQAIPQVKNAVVVPRRQENGDISLCAFVTSTTITSLNTDKLREALRKNLPHYMIPTHFIRLENIPLAPTGKADRKLLSLAELRFDNKEGKQDFVPPTSEMETLIANIWKEVLNVERVGIHDNFFDIGGNSLGIIQVSLKLKETFKRDIPALIMFEHSTIASMVAYLDEQSGIVETGAVIAQEEPKIQESSATKSQGISRMQQRRQQFRKTSQD